MPTSHSPLVSSAMENVIAQYEMFSKIKLVYTEFTFASGVYCISKICQNGNLSLYNILGCPESSCSWSRNASLKHLVSIILKRAYFY